MLQVLDSVLPKRCFLEIDDYVPFIFRCPDTHSSVPLYWRTGDFKTSLMEIGLNPNTGAICCIKVPFFGSAVRKAACWEQPTENVIQGIPVCKIDKWSTLDSFADNFRDEPYAFRAIIGLDFVTFWLVPETHLYSVFVTDQLCIGVDRDKKICKIEFRNLSKKDLDRIAPPSNFP